jgi:hypothetical protein
MQPAMNWLSRVGQSILTALLLLGIASCAADVPIALPDDHSAEEGYLAEEAYPGEVGPVATSTFLIDGEIRELTYQIIDGEYVFEGDIILDPSSGVTEPIPAQIEGELAVRTGSLWPNGIVPYTISSDAPNKDLIREAIAYWNNNTNLRLVPRDGQSAYVTFRSGSGCSANVGRIGAQQYISLSSACSLGAIKHEIGHAIGLWHEQSRTDRGNYINILWNNIQDGHEHNFETYEQRGQTGQNVGTYDIRSLMHYGSYAFSRNGNPTITRKDGSTFSAQRSGLSATELSWILGLYPPPCDRMSPAGSSSSSADPDMSCHGGNAAKIDGSPVGLDQQQGGTLQTIGDFTVAGCVRVYFSEPKTIDVLEIVARPVSNACSTGTACVGSYCQEGKQLAIFYTNALADGYTQFGGIQLQEGDGGGFVKYRLEFDRQAKHILLCRPAYGAARGDIQIDGLSACAP